MLPDALNHELSREPFIPLRICVSDGHSYVVRNPKLCLITRGALYIARTDRLDSRLADDIDVVDVRHITRVEQILEEARVPDRLIEKHLMIGGWGVVAGKPRMFMRGFEWVGEVVSVAGEVRLVGSSGDWVDGAYCLL